MVILALETVTRSGSLALWDRGTCHAMTGDPLRKHGERLPLEITAWLGQHGRTLTDVDIFAAASGPGSFTGLRVGLATVQGLALAGHRRTLGISSLDALAATWHLAGREPRLVAPCLDGQRGEVFASVVALSPADAPPAPALVRVEPMAVRPDAFAQTLASFGAGPMALVGDGAERYADLFRAAIPDATIAAAPRPLAEGVAWLAAAQAEQAGAPHALRPIYLRRPDAELARERASRSAEASAPLWRIRPAAGAADIRAIEAIQARTFSNPWSEDALKWELEHSSVARLFVLTDREEAVRAFCACWFVADELHINSLAVDPSHRRQGLGRQLLQAVLREAAAAGARSATLEVRASNDPARRLYEQQGFSVEGIRHGYYRDPEEDALVLWRRG